MIEFCNGSHRAAVMTMEVVTGDETLQICLNEEMPQQPVNLGPYRVSPLSGLHFDAADDTAAS